MLGLRYEVTACIYQFDVFLIDSKVDFDVLFVARLFVLLGLWYTFWQNCRTRVSKILWVTLEILNDRHVHYHSARNSLELISRPSLFPASVHFFRIRKGSRPFCLYLGYRPLVFELQTQVQVQVHVQVYLA